MCVRVSKADKQASSGWTSRGQSQRTHESKQQIHAKANASAWTLCASSQQTQAERSLSAACASFHWTQTPRLLCSHTHSTQVHTCTELLLSHLRERLQSLLRLCVDALVRLTSTTIDAPSVSQHSHTHTLQRVRVRLVLLSHSVLIASVLLSHTHVCTHTARWMRTDLLERRELSLRVRHLTHDSLRQRRVLLLQLAHGFLSSRWTKQANQRCSCARVRMRAVSIASVGDQADKDRLCVDPSTSALSRTRTASRLQTHTGGDRATRRGAPTHRADTHTDKHHYKRNTRHQG